MNGAIQNLDKPSGSKSLKWRVQIYTEKLPSGKWGRSTATVNGSKAEAEVELRARLTKLDKGEVLTPAKMTVTQLLHEWLEADIPAGRTHDGYLSIIRNHLAPDLGAIKLKDLKGPAIQRYFNAAEGTREDGKHPARTLNHWFRVLSEALKYAKRVEYIAVNPANNAKAPSAKRPTGGEMRCMNADECNRLLAAASGTYYYHLIYTALQTGMRQGELLALRWRDVDLKPNTPVVVEDPETHQKRTVIRQLGTISVNRSLFIKSGEATFKEPKTDRSRRSLPLSENLVTSLVEYKAERARIIYQLEQRGLLPDDIVFTSVHFQPMCASIARQAFLTCAARAGISGVRFHDARHSYASLLLQAHVPVHVVSALLGHASIRVTIDFYSHVMPGMTQDAADIMDRLLPADILTGRNTNHNTGES